MGHKAGVRILLVLGFVAAFVAYDAWIVSHVVLDPGATRAAAHALLDTPAVRKRLADQITRELEQRVPGAKHDPRANAAVAVALRDPRVESAFSDTVAQIHAAVLSGRGRTFTIDGHALSNALYDALAPSDPRLAAQVRRVPPLAVHIEADNLPKLHDPRSTADVVTVLALMAALLLVTASLVLQPDRRTVGLVGRRTALLAVGPLLVFTALPRVLAYGSGDAPQIASALLRAYGHRVLPSAIALLVIGLTIAFSAIAWPRHALRDSAPPRNAEPEPVAPRISEKMYL